MKKFNYWLCLAALLINISVSSIGAQQTPPPDPPLTLFTMVNRQWDLLADFRARFEQVFHVTLTRENAYEIFHSILPEIIDRVELDMSIKWGVFIRSENGGLTLYPAPPGTPRWKPGKLPIEIGGPQWIRFGGPVGFIIAVWGAYNLEDKIIEGIIYRYMTEVEGMSEADAKKEANYLSDLYEKAVAEFQKEAFPTSQNMAPLLIKLLQELERLYEQNQDRYKPGERNGTPHHFAPVGDGFPGFGQLHCSPGGNPYTPLPVGEPSAPGSNGTSGSFDGSIDVSGSALPPC